MFRNKESLGLLDTINHQLHPFPHYKRILSTFILRCLVLCGSHGIKFNTNWPKLFFYRFAALHPNWPCLGAPFTVFISECMRHLMDIFPSCISCGLFLSILFRDFCPTLCHRNVNSIFPLVLSFSNFSQSSAPFLSLTHPFCLNPPSLQVGKIHFRNHVLTQPCNLKFTVFYWQQKNSTAKKIIKYGWFLALC